MGIMIAVLVTLLFSGLTIDHATKPIEDTPKAMKRYSNTGLVMFALMLIAAAFAFAMMGIGAK